MAAILLAGVSASSALAAAPSTSPLPKGMLGITPNVQLTDGDMMKMKQAAADTARYGLAWGAIQPNRGGQFRWRQADGFMVRAARRGLAVNLIMSTTPPWAGTAPDPWDPPIETAAGRTGWVRFVRAAVDRYGRGGAFWRAHRQFSYRPVAWTVWNEPNLIRFWNGGPAPSEFANLVDLTGPVVRAEDPTATIITGGVFCDYGWKGYLQRFYQSVDKANFDAVAIHPYSESPYGSYRLIREARQVLDNQRDTGAEIWIDEISWGTDTTKDRFTTTPRKQADNIRILFQILAYQRGALKLGKLLWYGFKDAPFATDCLFCPSSGLWLANGVKPKPSWFVFKGFGSGKAGSIRGTVRNHKDKPAPGQRLYLDLNDDGLYNGGEPARITIDDGTYSFPRLFPTSYVVRLVPQEGQRCKKPKSCARTVDVAAGEEVGKQRFVVGPNPPNTKITKAKVKSKKRKAKFEFKGRRGTKPYEFECKMDKKRWKDCESGAKYKHLKAGKHKFKVRAIDSVGLKDRTPAKEKFKIKRKHH